MSRGIQKYSSDGVFHAVTKYLTLHFTKFICMKSKQWLLGEATVGSLSKTQTNSNSQTQSHSFSLHAKSSVKCLNAKMVRQFLAQGPGIFLSAVWPECFFSLPAAAGEREGGAAVHPGLWPELREAQEHVRVHRPAAAAGRRESQDVQAGRPPQEGQVGRLPDGPGRGRGRRLEAGGQGGEAGPERLPSERREVLARRGLVKENLIWTSHSVYLHYYIT